MRFKKNKVWLATGSEGKPIAKDGKMLIKYQLDQDYEYWVKATGVVPLDSPSTTPAVKQKEKLKDRSSQRDHRHKRSASGQADDEKDVIYIFTDGASAGNPGPSGIGVVMRYGQHDKEISKYIGIATNNIAELKAIEKGLLSVKNTDLPVRLFTDSNYAYGVLALGWKTRKNKDIVASVKRTISKFKDLKFIKVKGHSGHEGNERADFLARTAIIHAAAK
jgi:ribonuclease HI